MALSNLETIIENIEQLVENVRADNHGRILLPKDNLKQLLGELKAAVPSEIKKYSEKTQELERNKNKELEKARLNAERIMSEANEMRDKLLNENEQVKLAEKKSEQIIKDAMNKANSIMADGSNKAKLIYDRSMKEYDDILAYSMNLIQTLGNDIANVMNGELQNLSGKLNEIAKMRSDLYENIRRSGNNQNNNGNSMGNASNWG